MKKHVIDRFPNLTQICRFYVYSDHVFYYFKAKIAEISIYYTFVKIQKIHLSKSNI